MKRFIKVLKALGKGILVLLLITVAALLLMRWVFVRQLRAEIAEIKARGEPLTEAEMADPPVPDAENAALVYEKAFKELPPYKTFWDQIEPIEKLMKNDDSASMDKARQLMKPYAMAFALSKQAASMPKCAFHAGRHVRYFDSPGFKLRCLSRIAFIYAVLYARDGKMDDAVDVMMTGLSMNNMHEGESELFSAVHRESMVLWAYVEIKKIAGCGQISEPQARKLCAQLRRVDVMAIHRRGLQGDRAYILTMDNSDPVTWTRRRGIPVSTWDAVRLSADPVNLAWRNVILFGDEAAWLHLYGKLIHADYSTYAKAKSQLRDMESRIPFYAIQTKIIAPVLVESLDSPFRADAQIKGSQVFLALLAYHDTHKAYPSSLAELRKDPGWEIPRDPFTGKEFIYKKQGYGFLLYSVGRDLKDNGGKLLPKGKAYSADAEYDIPWEMKR